MIPRPEDWQIPSRGPVVVKLGGSLLLWKSLPQRLSRFLEWCRAEGAMVILVTGGGMPANFVRDLDHAHGMDDAISHDLAVRAMDLNSHCLASLLPRQMAVVDHFSGFGPVWNAGKTPVIAPHRFLTEVDARSTQALPASWRVTSDSIAARLAECVGAHDLILLKSKDVPPGTTLRQAVRHGLVDPMLPRIAARVPRIMSLNFRDPSAVARELIKA